MSIHDRKAKRQKAKEPYVSPQNRMDPEMIKGFDSKPGQAVMEMDPERIMPMFMFISDVQLNLPGFGAAEMNLMFCVSHIKKTNRLEARGRMRYEDTGRKTSFGLKQDFALSELEEAKAKVREMYKTMREEMHLFQSHEPWELNFEVGESIDSVISKLNASNHFNIGVVPKN